MPDVSGLVTTTVLGTKIKEVDNKIPDITSLVKKTYYDANTARKTKFSFSKCSEKMVFPKQLHWNMIFLIL